VQKRAQRDDKEAASCRGYEICREGTEAQRRGSLEAACRRVTPRGFCMDVKRKGLRGKEGTKRGHCQQPWVREYRIRYYLSSEKLKAIVSTSRCPVLLAHDLS